MANGKIGVTTENIFPVIKKFLYSDNEIFLRELVSNAVDATRKLRTLNSFGEFKGELGNLDVRVSIDKEAGTLTVSDHGIGMDADDIEKYINQIAFSGAEEFLAKYKDTANSIIGHFGLGFYSAFMVAKKVEIRSLSYKDGAQAVEWSCDGSPEYEMHPIEKAERGTDIILYIDDESKEYLEKDRIIGLLKKYCRFLPVPVICGKKEEWKDGKYVETDEDNIVNATEPLWTRKPADLTDEDYLKFYRELMPGREDPLFWIHLNVDYPFTLTGILYFPKVKSNLDLQRNRIQLYCNQVYVTDQVEGVVPEFMTIMQGVIDSPDIPLNVSRSYLQSDRQVKKISSYISKKVAEKLEKLYSSDRSEFEKKWDDIRIFIEYGMLTDEKFYESARKFYLLKDVQGKYFSLEDYKKLVESNQTDKNSTLIYLYTNDPVAQYSYIKEAEGKGYNVLLMDGELDSHFMSMLESKDQKLRFVRVDSDIPERLIVKQDNASTDLTPLQSDILQGVFSADLPEVENAHFIVSLENLNEDSAPATVIQDEFMRRMKQMAAQQPGMMGAVDLPDSYQFVVNTAHPAVRKILGEASSSLDSKVKPILDEINSLNDEIAKSRDPKANEGLSEEAKKEAEKAVADKENKVNSLRSEQSSAISGYAKDNALIRQVIDLALLQAGLLKGKSLSEFIQRSVSLL
ncbi:MAG: molecular chaperone HtpG [Muribaculaceae bacterium]|nr:molecular chaperone HtpG [Muribaculaceae bacterium]